MVQVQRVCFGQGQSFGFRESLSDECGVGGPNRRFHRKGNLHLGTPLSHLSVTLGINQVSFFSDEPFYKCPEKLTLVRAILPPFGKHFRRVTVSTGEWDKLIRPWWWLTDRGDGGKPLATFGYVRSYACRCSLEFLGDSPFIPMAWWIWVGEFIWRCSVVHRTRRRWTSLLLSSLHNQSPVSY